MQQLAVAINKDEIFIPDDIKIRLVPIRYSWMGLQEQKHQAISAELIVLDNKTKDQLNTILDEIQSVLQTYFAEFQEKTSITSRLTLVAPAHYRRWVNYV